MKPHPRRTYWLACALVLALAPAAAARGAVTTAQGALTTDRALADRREHRLALLTRDGRGVQQAVWSESTYLSWVYHSAVSRELVMADVERRLAESTTALLERTPARKGGKE